MFYRNSYTNKPKGAIWSDESNASDILNTEFFEAPAPPSGGGFGRVKIGGVFVDIIDTKFKSGSTFTSIIGKKVKISGTFVDVL